ncbi:DUF6036 family nucleotidyltransferase [Microlunatus antarcticus]|uniref:Putative nucleotidyltransferase n=1 Tax=Microlunatus antarcticus TaxID=53388 RepID=A0A7W5JXB3_9ACTN|nr:DUF6036 family nucleotidyltransferase [Microlunatus antarcticus]MBB3328044.1 putative nucleotidyltransferase [Microlunatus antarcticus]
MAAGSGVPRWSLDAERVRELLILLDERLKRRGVAASVYVVGGVAVALRAQPRRLTIDVDAMVSDQAVLEEAEAMALEEGLPPGWLNSAARPWLPPRPPEALAERSAPGLDVHVAPLDHLLAMKIIAFRDRDVEDIRALAVALQLDGVSAEELRALVADVYATPELLATAIGGSDREAGDELRLRCERVARFLQTRS